MLLFFALFISIPLIEIYLFLKVGEFIGPSLTILMIIFTAITGGFLVKKKGLTTLKELKSLNIQNPKGLINTLGNGIFIIISGILLITPGFITDFFGFILFFKITREFVIKFVFNKIKLSNSSDFIE